MGIGEELLRASWLLVNPCQSLSYTWILHVTRGCVNIAQAGLSRRSRKHLKPQKLCSDFADYFGIWRCLDGVTVE